MTVLTDDKWWPMGLVLATWLLKEPSPLQPPSLAVRKELEGSLCMVHFVPPSLFFSLMPPIAGSLTYLT